MNSGFDEKMVSLYKKFIATRPYEEWDMEALGDPYTDNRMVMVQLCEIHLTLHPVDIPSAISIAHIATRSTTSLLTNDYLVHVLNVLKNRGHVVNVSHDSYIIMQMNRDYIYSQLPEGVFR